MSRGLFFPCQFLGQIGLHLLIIGIFAKPQIQFEIIIKSDFQLFKCGIFSRFHYRFSPIGDAAQWIVFPAISDGVLNGNLFIGQLNYFIINKDAIGKEKREGSKCDQNQVSIPGWFPIRGEFDQTHTHQDKGNDNEESKGEKRAVKWF